MKRRKKMKKSKILMLLSALLCVVMMFASCNEEPEPTPEPTFADYVDEWLEYIEYTDTAFTAPVADFQADSTVAGTYGRNGHLVYTVKATLGTPVTGEDGKITATAALTYEVYNLLESDEDPVWEKSFESYVAALNTSETTANYSNVTNKPISIALRGSAGVFGVVETAADGTKTYNVYDELGTAIAENASEANYSAYYMQLPALDEYKGNRYYIDYDAGVVQVYDNAYSIKLEKEFTADNTGFVILSNGDVLVMLMNMVDEDSEEYDVELGGMKLTLDYKLVSISTGEVKDVEFDYYPWDILTSDDGITGDNNLVTAYKITENKTLAAYPDFLVLDNELKLVKELQKLVKNQTDVPDFANADTILVNATAGGTDYIYAIDTAAEAPEVKLYATNAERIDGGIFANGVIYDTEMNELVDLNDNENNESWTVVGDVVRVTRQVKSYKTVNGDPVLDDVYYVYDIYAIKNGNIEKTQLGKTETENSQQRITYYFGGEIWVVHGEDGETDKVYNKYGKCLTAANYNFTYDNFTRIDDDGYMITYSKTTEDKTTQYVYIYK